MRKWHNSNNPANAGLPWCEDQHVVSYRLYTSCHNTVKWLNVMWLIISLLPVGTWQLSELKTMLDQQGLHTKANKKILGKSLHSLAFVTFSLAFPLLGAHPWTTSCSLGLVLSALCWHLPARVKLTQLHLPWARIIRPFHQLDLQNRSDFSGVALPSICIQSGICLVLQLYLDIIQICCHALKWSSAASIEGLAYIPKKRTLTLLLHAIPMLCGQYHYLCWFSSCQWVPNGSTVVTVHLWFVWWMQHPDPAFWCKVGPRR